MGLLGAAYLLLLVVVLIWPPEPRLSARSPPESASGMQQPASTHRQRSRRQAQRPAQPATASAALSPADGDWELQEPLLTPTADADTATLLQDGSAGLEGQHGSQQPQASALRWLLPALLAVLCAADLTAQYALVVGALVQERPLLPPAVAAWIRDVVGIDDRATGEALLLALLRPTLLMTALAVYRCGI